MSNSNQSWALLCNEILDIINNDIRLICPPLNIYHLALFDTRTSPQSGLSPQILFDYFQAKPHSRWY